MGLFMSQSNPNITISEVTPEVLSWLQVEAGFRPESVLKYKDCLKHAARILSDPPIRRLAKTDILRLKSDLISRNLSASRQTGIIIALKRLLLYCRDELKIVCLDPEELRPPKRPRRVVEYLTPEDIQKFTDSIRVETYRGAPHLSGLRFRALVEVLLGTAMRISEVLSLNRDQINCDLREAQIVGKGNKERTVFFTERSLTWVARYLKTRCDDNPALFVTQKDAKRMKRTDVWRFFKRHTRLSGLKRPVRPHLLRHTAATQLLFNGCPVGHIKEILGHERLETTCRYYLGLDHRAAKRAHEQYLHYEVRDGDTPVVA